MYVSNIFCIISFKKQWTNLLLLNTVSSEDVFLLCHEGRPTLISVRWCSWFQVLHLPMMAPNKPCAMAGPWWEAERLQATPGAVPNWASCSALFTVLIQGPDNPCLAPSPLVKRLTGGQETLVPLPPSAPASREPCGEAAVSPRCAGRTRCSWDKGMHTLRAWFITTSEKHNSETCKIITHLIHAHQEQILGWLLFFLSSSDFFFEDEKEESKPSGRGTSRDTRKLKCMHTSSTTAVTSSLHFATQRLIILNLNFSSLSKVPKSIPFWVSETSHRTLQRKLTGGINCCNADKLQGYI